MRVRQWSQSCPDGDGRQSLSRAMLGRVWVFQTPGMLNRQADWLARHGGWLRAAWGVAIGLAVVAAVLVVLRRRSWRIGVAVGAIALAVAGLAALGEAAASVSNAREIEHRVHQVAGVLRPAPSRTSVSEYDDAVDNETYTVATNIASIERSVRAAFDSPGATGLNNGGVSGSGDFLTISFLGRGGCDGTVDIQIRSTPSTDSTTVRIFGHCED